MVFFTNHTDTIDITIWIIKAFIPCLNKTVRVVFLLYDFPFPLRNCGFCRDTDVNLRRRKWVISGNSRKIINWKASTHPHHYCRHCLIYKMTTSGKSMAFGKVWLWQIRYYLTEKRKEYSVEIIYGQYHPDWNRWGPGVLYRYTVINQWFCRQQNHLDHLYVGGTEGSYLEMK